MCAMIEKHLSSEGKAQGILKKAVVFINLSNEGFNIIIHATRLGLIISKKVRDILELLIDGGDKDKTQQNRLSDFNLYKKMIYG